MEQSPEQIKSKILSIIRIRGPSLPVQIARETKTSSIFAGAFLSELASDKEIKISNLKVGSSPLYFLPGQEVRLEKFYNYLPDKEKEAFLLLKQKRLLDDKKQEPAIRVALRNIKDFSIPLVMNIDGQQTLFWKYYSVTEEETTEKLIQKPVKAVIQKEITVKIPKETIVKIRQQKLETEKPILEASESLDSDSSKTESFGSARNSEEFRHAQKFKKISDIKPTKRVKLEKKPKEKPDFAKKIISLLNSGNIEILEEREAKKREFSAIIKINSELGKLKFLCIAKDKKRITENDITLVIQKAQSLKMPALFLSQGELNNNASNYLEQHSGLIKFKKLT